MFYRAWTAHGWSGIIFKTFVYKFASLTRLIVLHSDSLSLKQTFTRQSCSTRFLTLMAYMNQGRSVASQMEKESSIINQSRFSHREWEQHSVWSQFSCKLSFSIKNESKCLHLYLSFSMKDFSSRFVPWVISLMDWLLMVSNLAYYEVIGIILMEPEIYLRDCNSCEADYENEICFKSLSSSLRYCLRLALKFILWVITF